MYCARFELYYDRPEIASRTQTSAASRGDITRALRRKLNCAMALSLTCSVAAGPTFAADCGFLSGFTLKDRELYYQTPGTSRWAKMDAFGTDFHNQKITFAYVILEDFAEARDGVLIIKSGRIRQMGEPPLRQSSIKLVRVDERFPNRDCGTPAPFGKRGRGRVSARSYDDYHDRGLNVGGQDQATLNSFHFRYAARRGCRLTNDPTPDSYAVLDFRSNLSQFSFDPDVVRRGTYSQVIALFGIGTASAASDGLTDRRVETKQYHSLPHKPVCVVFKLAVGGAASFLRINDLEALKEWGNRYIRADEQSWALSQ